MTNMISFLIGYITGITSIFLAVNLIYWVSSWKPRGFI